MDRSSGSPKEWFWTFGDGSYSTKQNPIHTYQKAGQKTVKLQAKNVMNSMTVSKPGFIKVGSAPVTMGVLVSGGIKPVQSNLILPPGANHVHSEQILPIKGSHPVL